MTKPPDKHSFEQCGGNKMTHWLLTLQIQSFGKDFISGPYYKTITEFGNAKIRPGQKLFFFPW
jgi:hypothetical protein